jgi:hypothetical protein
VQLEGTGIMAGPPARGRTLDVGSAEASEQSAVTRIEVEERMAINGGVGMVAMIGGLMGKRMSSCQLRFSSYRTSCAI